MALSRVVSDSGLARCGPAIQTDRRRIGMGDHPTVNEHNNNDGDFRESRRVAVANECSLRDHGFRRHASLAILCYDFVGFESECGQQCKPGLQGLLPSANHAGKFNCGFPR